MELGGYFSIKRNATSIPGDTWLDVEEVAPYCKAILEVFRYSILSLLFLIDSQSVLPLKSCSHSRLHSLTSMPTHIFARPLVRLFVFLLIHSSDKLLRPTGVQA